MRATICACQRFASSLLRTALPRSSASSCALKFRLRAPAAPFHRRPSSRRRHLRRAFSRAPSCRRLPSPLRPSRRPPSPRPAFSASSRSASSRSFSSCAAFFSCSCFSCSSFSCASRSSSVALDLGRIRLGRPLLFDGRRLGFGHGFRCRFGRRWFGRGSGFGAMPFSARSSTTVASMASVSTGGGWCFQVNQP